MARYTKQNVNSVPSINAELTKIQTAINDTLSRKGDEPNQMEANLDMNSNRVINLPEPVSDHEPFRKGDLPIVEATLQPLVDEATSQANRAEQEANRAQSEADSSQQSAVSSAASAAIAQQYPEGQLAAALAAPNSDVLVGGVEAGNLVYPVSDIPALLVAPNITGRVYSVTSYHPGWAVQIKKPIGGGAFIWQAGRPKSDHNGGTVIDPSKGFPSDWTNSSSVLSWYSAAASGEGCWVRQYETGYLLAEWFGAVPWVIGGSQDSTLPFQQCANTAGPGGSWKWSGRHRITSFVEIPFKQTFGSFGQMTSVSVELFDPSNFQGVHTSPFPTVADKVDSAVFYDAASGEAFRCNEAASPNNFLLYGRGYNVMGPLSLTPALPSASNYLSTSGIRYGKYIRPENVTVILFRQAFDSFAWTEGGSYVGDYYSKFTNCEVMWCLSILRVALEETFNTKFVNMRAYVNRLGDFGTSVRNMQFVGGAIEGFNLPTTIRSRSSLSFVGTYFETFDTAFNGAVFNVVGFSTLSLKDCLCYMNYVSSFASSGGSGQGSEVNFMVLNSSGNTWWRTDGGSGTVFDISTVPNKTLGVYADFIYLSNSSSLTYISGTTPGIYSAPLVLTA